MDASDLLARYDRACYLAQLNRNEEAKEELEIVLREDDSGFFVELIEDDENLADCENLKSNCIRIGKR